MMFSERQAVILSYVLANQGYYFYIKMGGNSRIDNLSDEDRVYYILWESIEKKVRVNVLSGYFYFKPEETAYLLHLIAHYQTNNCEEGSGESLVCNELLELLSNRD
jgi:hypothetical protein